MRNRDKGFKYYGISPQDEQAIKKACQNATRDQCILLMDAATVANSELADDLYYSLRRDLSYDTINKYAIIPISKTDFYAYRRKCMKAFWDLMILHENRLLTECGEENK